MCPNFVGPRRVVGQLLAVVLRFWDTPLADFVPYYTTIKGVRAGGGERSGGSLLEFALGISSGAWVPFVAWAMGWIPLYEIALLGAALIVAGATIGSAPRIRRWQKLLQSESAPPSG